VRDALLGACLLEACPVFLILSFTFMTDILWLTPAIWFAYALVKAVQARSNAWLIAATIFGCMAGAVRVTGAAFPLITMAVLWFHAPGWGRRVIRLAIPAAGFIALVLFFLTCASYTERHADLTWIVNSPANRTRKLPDGFLLLYKSVPLTVISMAGILGFWLLPVALGSFRKTDFRRAAWIFAALFAMTAGLVWTKRYFPFALAVNSTWSAWELGATEPTLNQYLGPQDPGWMPWLMAVPAYSAFSLILAALRGRDTTVAVMRWIIVAQFFEIAILFLFYDRYLLMALPFSIVPIVIANGIRRPVWTIAAAAIFLAVGMIGVRDHLEYNRSLWSAVASLRSEGIAASEIDGGYVVNGWLQYAHPEDARRDARGDVVVPRVNSLETRRHQISNRPVSQWTILKQEPYRRWLSHSGSIYILVNPQIQ
jgi:hypothetical protein